MKNIPVRLQKIFTSIGRKTPARIFIRVDLPAPLSPKRPNISPD